ncbi:MAG TPA: hypothetical protein VFA05_10655 [Gaiellaceae bacterium]|nr:hypothetical protein [Gaiellaceae bacterium]
MSVNSQSDPRAALVEDRAATWARAREPSPVAARPARYARRAAALLLCVWIPALLGKLGLSPFHAWAVLCGYVGLSWLLPGFLLRAASRAWLLSRNAPAAAAGGWLAGGIGAGALLLASASLIGG